MNSFFISSNYVQAWLLNITIYNLKSLEKWSKSCDNTIFFKQYHLNMFKIYNAL